MTSCSSRVTCVPANATIRLGSVAGGAGTPGARSGSAGGAGSPSPIGTIRHSIPRPGSLTGGALDRGDRPVVAALAIVDGSSPSASGGRRNGA